MLFSAPVERMMSQAGHTKVDTVQVDGSRKHVLEFAVLRWLSVSECCFIGHLLLNPRA